MNQQIIYVCSDGVGETAEMVARAALRQFPGHQAQLKRYGRVRSEDEIATIVQEAVTTGGFIAYTLVQPELREMMVEEARRCSVRIVDVMGPMLQAYIDTFNDVPRQQPDPVYALDTDYYERMEAIEFAVRTDDGKDISGLGEAQIVLLGVSRTSKTPLSIYLAHKGFRVANLPLVPEMKLPPELDNMQQALVVGLTMDAEQMVRVREERLKSLGLPAAAQYASMGRVEQELRYADQTMASLTCRVIDVSNRAIEETAGIILGWMNEESTVRINK